jgi:hypothetical protein
VVRGASLKTTSIDHKPHNSNKKSTSATDHVYNPVRDEGAPLLCVVATDTVVTKVAGFDCGVALEVVIGGSVVIKPGLDASPPAAVLTSPTDAHGVLVNSSPPMEE